MKPVGAASPQTNGSCGTGEAVAVKSESAEIPSNNIVAYKNQPSAENPHNLRGHSMNPDSYCNIKKWY